MTGWRRAREDAIKKGDLKAKAAGRIRTLVAELLIRIMIARTLETASDIISCCDTSMSGKWVVLCMGNTSVVEKSDVVSMINKWSTHCEFNMPTFHLFSSVKVVVISVSSGV